MTPGHQSFQSNSTLMQRVADSAAQSTGEQTSFFAPSALHGSSIQERLAQMEDDEDLEDESHPHVPNIIRNEDSSDYINLRRPSRIYEERKE